MTKFSFEELSFFGKPSLFNFKQICALQCCISYISQKRTFFVYSFNILRHLLIATNHFVELYMWIVNEEWINHSTQRQNVFSNCDEATNFPKNRMNARIAFVFMSFALISYFVVKNRNKTQMNRREIKKKEERRSNNILYFFLQFCSLAFSKKE